MSRRTGIILIGLVVLLVGIEIVVRIARPVAEQRPDRQRGRHTDREPGGDLSVGAAWAWALSRPARAPRSG